MASLKGDGSHESRPNLAFSVQFPIVAAFTRGNIRPVTHGLDRSLGIRIYYYYTISQLLPVASFLVVCMFCSQEFLYFAASVQGNIYPSKLSPSLKLYHRVLQMVHQLSSWLFRICTIAYGNRSRHIARCCLCQYKFNGGKTSRSLFLRLFLLMFCLFLSLEPSPVSALSVFVT